VHPEQYSNTFSDEEMDRIHDSIDMVCTTACDLLAESSKFPEDWLMRYRWGKGKKKDNTLPNGHAISFLTVGGRTSAVVAALQKKTGPVSENLKVEEAPDAGDEDAGSPLKPKTKPASKAKAVSKAKAKAKAKAEPKEEPKDVEVSLPSRRKSLRKSAPKAFALEETDDSDDHASSGRTNKRKAPVVETKTKAKRSKK
jgi:formamidopyrimidine-DNA glycosylase